MNEHNLPQVVVNALSSNEYVKRPGYSATTLIKPPQMKALGDRYEEDEQDVMGRLWSVLGTAVHNVMEKYQEPEALSEAHYNCDMLGHSVNGTVDHYIDGVISDFKVTSAWKYVGKDFAEWEQQLNIYAYLMGDTHKVDGLQIIGVFRDWSAMQALRNPEYPQQPVTVIPIKLWSREAQYDFIAERLSMHIAASESADEDLPECTDKERWYTGTKYAVYKGKNVRATKLFDEQSEAEEFASKIVGSSRVETRVGENKRCDKYCPMKSHCKQYERMING